MGVHLYRFGLVGKIIWANALSLDFMEQETFE